MIAATVLAGGEGRRIGGDKPLRTLGGMRLIDRALIEARQWSSTVAVCVRHPDQVPSVAEPIIRDDPAVEGPLGGLVSALRFAAEHGCELLLTLPADMPLLPQDLAARLSASLTADTAAAVASSGGHLHPVCALWRTAARKRIESYIATGKRSLRGFAECVGFVGVDWPVEPFDPFFNINTIEDLATAKRLLAR